MDKSKVQKLTNENNGFLKIKGIALDRRIYLFDEVLTPEESIKIINHSPDGFNWGYGGSGPAQLALAIMQVFVSDAIAANKHNDFKEIFVKQFPDFDFEVEVNIKFFLNAIVDDVSLKNNKMISAFQLMRVRYGYLFVPKFLDVLNIKNKDFLFSEDTLEYQWLKNLTSDSLKSLQVYITTNSERYSHQNKNNKENLNVIGFTNIDGKNYFVINNGIGSGTNHGHNLEDYENFA